MYYFWINKVHFTQPRRCTGTLTPSSCAEHHASKSSYAHARALASPHLGAGICTYTQRAVRIHPSLHSARRDCLHGMADVELKIAEPTTALPAGWTSATDPASGRCQGPQRPPPPPPSPSFDDRMPCFAPLVLAMSCHACSAAPTM